MVARLGFEKAMVGTRRATQCSDCMDRLRKHYSHLAEGWFLARTAAWALSGCMATDSADYYEGSATKEISYTVSRNPIIQKSNEIQKSTLKSRNPI